MTSSMLLKSFVSSLHTVDDFSEILRLALTADTVFDEVVKKLVELVNKLIDSEMTEKSSLYMSDEEDRVRALISNLTSRPGDSKSSLLYITRKFVRLLHIVNSANKFFSRADEDVALDYIHIRFLLKEFDMSEKVEDFRKLDDSHPLKSTYSTVLMNVKEVAVTAKDSKITLNILAGEYLEDFIELKDLLDNQWALVSISRKFTQMDLNIAYKSKRMFEFLENKKWNRATLEKKKKFRILNEVYIITEEYDKIIGKIGCFMYHWSIMNYESKSNIKDKLRSSGVSYDDILVNDECMSNLDVDTERKRECFLQGVFMKFLLGNRYEGIDFDEQDYLDFYLEWSNRNVLTPTVTKLDYDNLQDEDKDNMQVLFDFLKVINLSTSISPHENTAESNSVTTKTSFTELHRKARDGTLDNVILADATSTYAGFTPLHWACYKGRTNVVKQLIERLDDIDIDMQDTVNGNGDGWTPLMWASMMGYGNIVETWLTSKKSLMIDSVESGRLNMFHYLSSLHRKDIIESFRKYYENSGFKDYRNFINKFGLKDQNGWTVLHHAVSRSGARGDCTLKYLLEYYNKQLVPLHYEDNRNNYSALCVAAYNGHTERVKMLLDDEALKNNDEVFLLILAARRGHSGVVHALLNRILKAREEFIHSVTDESYEAFREFFSNICKSYEILSKDVYGLKAPVVWILYAEVVSLLNLSELEIKQHHGLTQTMISDCRFYSTILQKYQIDMLSHMTEANIKELYESYFLNEKPYLVKRSIGKLSLRKNEFMIDFKGLYNPKDNHQKSELVKVATTFKAVEKSSDRSSPFLNPQIAYNYYANNINFKLLHFDVVKMDVSLYSFDVINTSSINFIVLFVFTLYKYVGLEIFELEFIQVSILCAWKRYGYIVHMVEIGVYLLYTTLFSITNYLFNHNDILSSSVGTFLDSILFVLTVFYFIIFFVKIKNSHNKYELSVTYHTYTELGALSFTLVASGYRFYYKVETQTSSHLMSFATILLYSRILYYLRPLEVTGPLVGMIEAIVWEIKYFLLILFIAILAFAQAMYLLSWKYDADGENFGKSAISLIRAYQYMTGDVAFGPAGTFNSSVADFIVVLFYLFTSVILLNLLISIMSSTYNKINENAKSEWYRQICKTLHVQPQWLRTLLCPRTELINFTYAKRSWDDCVVNKPSTDTREDTLSKSPEDVRIRTLHLWLNFDDDDFPYDPSIKVNEKYQLNISNSSGSDSTNAGVTQPNDAEYYTTDSLEPHIPYLPSSVEDSLLPSLGKPIEQHDTDLSTLSELPLDTNNTSKLSPVDAPILFRSNLAMVSPKSKMKQPTIKTPLSRKAASVRKSKKVGNAALSPVNIPTIGTTTEIFVNTSNVEPNDSMIINVLDTIDTSESLNEMVPNTMSSLDNDRRAVPINLPTPRPPKNTINITSPRSSTNLSILSARSRQSSVYGINMNVVPRESFETRDVSLSRRESLDSLYYGGESYISDVNLSAREPVVNLAESKTNTDRSSVLERWPHPR